MEFGGLKPNDITFLSLLCGCSHTGLTDEGLECFNEMISRHNIVPRAEHFSCMVDLYARRGQLEEAYNMICRMNIKPNASLWGAILGACSIYGNMPLGKTAAMHIFGMDPENLVNYVVLASIYTAAGAWNNAWKVRNLLKERKLKKATASSLLQSTEIKFELLQAN
uniref:Pentatricopeptide repeat-containing family protein n=1 Tax=Rhizophora mucronata TaxID=61149 RepID=A0A2P2NGP8_RHIMU